MQTIPGAIDKYVKPCIHQNCPKCSAPWHVQSGLTLEVRVMKCCGSQRARAEASTSQKESKITGCVCCLNSALVIMRSRHFFQISPREMEFVINRLYLPEFY